MDLKERTKQEIEKGKQKINGLIADYGVGSGYLSKAKRIQRTINVVLVMGAVVSIAGLLTWTAFKRNTK